MELAWRCRIMIFATLALMLFSDLFHYARVGGVQTNTNQPATRSNKFQQKNAEIDIVEDGDLSDFSTASELQQKRAYLKLKITDAIKDSCLPKMLCEMAAKPEYLLTEKEKDLLHLVRSSSLSLTVNGTPSKWHFAAHMGELLRYTGDDLTGPIGCANLWPHCPISSKTLLKLSYKVRL